MLAKPDLLDATQHATLGLGGRARLGDPPQPLESGLEAGVVDIEGQRENLSGNLRGNPERLVTVRRRIETEGSMELRKIFSSCEPVKLNKR